MPADAFDPSKILGCTPEEARPILRGKPVTPGEVEAAARTHYNWRKHIHDDDSYWVVASQAARILKLSPRQVSSMLSRRKLPFVRDVRGVRLMRRRDIEWTAERQSSPD